jgi:hypothetical protein
MSHGPLAWWRRRAWDILLSLVVHDLAVRDHPPVGVIADSSIGDNIIAFD